MEKAYNLNQTAELLGVTVRTVRHWVHSGIIKARKITGTNRWIVPQEEIMRLRGEKDADCS